ncbi:MAG: leucine-rich repeat domain-containing protein [bacterium]|nr:leucine-rich repeat domain-containing protein [bacterium]
MKPDILKKINHSNPRKVTELRLENGRLKWVPNEVKNFTRLKFLNLFNNKLKELPEFFADFNQLNNLNLNNNDFIILPEPITQIRSLKALSIKGNKLTDLGSLDGLSPNLEKLDLASNSLTVLRFGFEEFQQLKELDLSDNGIQKFPKSLMKCEKLTVLKLSGNKFKSIPNQIAELKKLTYLDLSYNDLKELPEEIGLLENLRTLVLTGNKIGTLPKAFGKLKKLKELNLNGNPIGDVPIEVSSQGLKAVLNYYMHLGVSVRLNEAKLLIVGQGAVGKTYLMNSLINGSSEETTTTEGIDIQKWTMNIQESDKKHRVRLNAWDFGGQEIYHSTHQFFLTKRSLYLFVWEARTDETLLTFDYWLNIIKVLSNSSPVIVVLNKIDERVKEIDRKSLMDKFKNIIGFASVSAKTGVNLDQLTELIQKNILKLPHIGDKLPKVWSDIRDELEDINDNYITYESYIEICNRFGLSKDESKHLSKYYHDLGVFLHFIDNSVLKPVVFLKPEWATNFVYKILDLKDVIESNGRFDSSLLEDQLSEYSSQQISYVIELMKKFELCFELRKNIYVIPELLSPSKPELDWDMEESISLEYKYDFMPAGIIPRLTVRLKELVNDGEIWKNGIYLKYKSKTFGSIIGNIFSRNIIIQVSGESKAFLLEKVKFELDNINESLNNPYYQLRIKCNCSNCINSDDPYMFDYEYLMRAKTAKISKVPCQQSLTNVNLMELIGPYEIKVQQVNEEFRFNSRDLTYDIIEIGTRMLERRNTVKLEDLITDNFTDNLRSKGYVVTDQTRSGISNTHSGELDVMIRNPRSMPIAILEAVKLTSIGLGNTSLIEHLNKLLIKYDTNGLPRNYIMVYAKTEKFGEFWKKYVDYIQNLHMHRLYDPRSELKSFSVNNELSSRSNLKVLISQHESNGVLSEVYHIVLNMN